MINNFFSEEGEEYKNRLFGFLTRSDEPEHLEYNIDVVERLQHRYISLHDVPYCGSCGRIKVLSGTPFLKILGADLKGGYYSYNFIRNLEDRRYYIYRYDDPHSYSAFLGRAIRGELYHIIVKIDNGLKGIMYKQIKEKICYYASPVDVKFFLVEEI